MITDPRIIALAWVGVILGHYLLVAMVVFDGAFRELIGHHGSGHHHTKLHRVLWQWYTGLHVNPHRSYGDERRLRRTASVSTRATPEGSIVYWTRNRRWHRALIRNLISVAIISFFFGLFVDAEATVQALTSALIVALALGVYALWLRARRRYAARPAQAIKVSSTLTKTGASGRAQTAYVQAGEVTLNKPTLANGVPHQVLALLLAGPVGVSSAEAQTLLALTPDRGQLMLPDRFAALGKDRETVEEIVRAQTGGQLSFRWHTDAMPRAVEWVPIVTSLPREVLFRDHLSAIEALRPGEFGVGLTTQREMYASSHNGDLPWHLRSAGPGTGKSTGFSVKAAQICHRDPEADLYCVDTKQVSFENMHDIPGVYVFDDPEARMRDIWDVFFQLEGIMRDRYTALRKHEATIDDFNDIWLLVDEGNDLASQLKIFYVNHIKQSGDPAQPTIWANPISALINLGRQARIRGEWMFQNMTDRALGGVSLRDAFPVVGMAGYKKNQWERIIGSKYQEPKLGPGRICMVKGTDETWVQGFYDDPQFLRQYAMATRQGRR